MITLYTPATGFPDLEMKIAYGLARVGIEADYNPVIIPQRGFYQIHYRGNSSEKVNQTFLMIASRLLSSSRFFNLGVKAKDKSKYPVNEETMGRLSTTVIFLIHLNYQILTLKETNSVVTQDFLSLVLQLRHQD